MVGNVIVNRLKADCLDFLNLRSVRDVIFQVQLYINRVYSIDTRFFVLTL
ncbi:hypothetical protein PDN14_22225 [Bacillus cereus group sp. Bc222]|nr:hypothetical protein [Bacillus paranthracis]MDA2241155.1 hypothetical protein [Bacillus cereus group sp. Bc222]MDG0927999.1 hypothetical protein [Bacillus paranthracis]